MIITFNPAIFDTKNKDLQRLLAKIIVLIIEKQHFIDLTMLNDIFFKDGNYSFNNHVIAEDFFSPYENGIVERAVYAIIGKSGYITQLHQNYLTRITIGQAAGEVEPAMAHRMLHERSKVIIENGINDWKFIESVCRKYTNHKQRGQIYKMIKTAILFEHLEPENAGGHGEIVKVTTRWIENRYKDIALFKLMVVFDSDRTSKNSINEIHEAKIAFLKAKTIITDDDYYKYESTDIMHWQMLYKRAIENYAPLSVLFKSIPLSEAQRIDLQSKTNDELDFIEYDTANIGLTTKKVKSVFPEIFGKEFSYKDLEARCEHHKVTIELPDGTTIQVSELEQILLKIAKII